MAYVILKLIVFLVRYLLSTLLGLHGTSIKKFDDICYLLAGSPILYTFVCDFESVFM